MKLRIIFIFIFFLFVVAILVSQKLLIDRSVQQDLEEINAIQIQYISQIVESAIETKKQEMIRIASSLGKNNDLASAYILSREIRDKLLVKKKIKVIEKDLALDFIDIVSEKGLVFLSKKNFSEKLIEKIGEDEATWCFKKIDNRPYLLVFSPIWLYGSRIGKIMLGKQLDSSFIDNIAILTKSKIVIGIQKDKMIDIQIELIKVPSIEISVTLLKNQLLVAFIGVIVMLILLYFAFEVLFFQKFKLIVNKAKAYSIAVQNGHIAGITITPSLVEENNIMSNALEKISNSIVYYDRTLKENLKSESELKQNKALFELASQVAHDIRSPLTSLSATVKEMTPLPEVTRQIVRGSVQRIQDIANSLISKYKHENNRTNENSMRPRLHLLSTAIEEITSEKRMQYETHENLTIRSYCEEGYYLVAMVDVIVFKRAISNLVNNAVEAIPDKNGDVSIQLIENHNGEDSVLIRITDNGKGIPPHILNRLGQFGQSYGKEDNQGTGSGMGLYYAKQAVESWNGTLLIESQSGKGTTVTITLPKAPSLPWYIEKLNIEVGTVLVVLDDDDGIHYTWEKKLTDMGQIGREIHLIHCQNAQELKDWIEKQSGKHGNTLYLCDQELVGSTENGLELIAEFGIAHQSILVTNHYDVQEIKESCRNLNIRIIPKIIVDYLPVTIQKRHSSHRLYDAVYIEDDKYLRIRWERTARKVGKHILTLKSPYLFNDHECQFSKTNTEIYIDSCLGENTLRGEEFAKILCARGYKNLFLVTSKSIDEFEDIPCLKWIGKQCPWDKELETVSVEDEY